MKTYNETMIIEQADNGIAVRDRFNECAEKFEVVVSGEEEKYVGRELFASIQDVMNTECVNRVKMTITYEPIE